MDFIYKGKISAHPNVEIKGDMLMVNDKALEQIEWKYSEKKKKHYDKITKKMKDGYTYDFILFKDSDYMMIGKSGKNDGQKKIIEYN